MKWIKNAWWLLVLPFIAFTGRNVDDSNYRFLSKDDILSSTWDATVDLRKTLTEIGIVYPFFIGDSYYQKGISIPLREKLAIKADKRYRYISFLLGIDQFLLPETKVKCRLVVKKDNHQVIYTSPTLTEKDKPQYVTIPVQNADSLNFELQEISRYTFDSPDNASEMAYLGADLVNFIYANDEKVVLPNHLSEKTVDENIGMEISAVPIPSSAWAVKFIPNSGPDGLGLALAGCFDNKLYAFNPQGKMLWQAPLKGVPQHIAYCYDGKNLRIGVFSWSVNTDLSIFDGNGKLLKTIDGDGRIKALAANKSNFYTVDYYDKLRKFSASGVLLSLDTLSNVKNKPNPPKVEGVTKVPKFSPSQPLNTVMLKVVHVPEINANRIMLGTTNTLICYDENAKLLWKRAINQGNLFQSATYEIAPMTINGVTHFVVGSRPGSVSILTLDGKILYRDRYLAGGIVAPEIALGNFTGTGAKQIVASTVDRSFYLLNEKAYRIKRWEQQLAFVDVDVMPMKGKDGVLAASMGPRDHQLYFLTFNNKGIDKGFDKIPAYRKDQVTPVMAEMKTDIDHIKPVANVKDSYISFLDDPFGGNFTNPKAFYNEQSMPEVIGRLKKMKKIVDSLSGNRVHFLPMFDIWSCVFHKERVPLQSSKLNLQVLAEAEKLDLPFAIFVLHGRSVPIEDLRKLVKQNKTTLKAFHFSERAGMSDYKRQVLQLAKEAGIKVLYGIHRDYWLNVSQDKEEFNALFDEQYRGVLVPIVKPHPGAFDLNWMSTFGLLKKGYLTEWGVASQGWNWDWSPRNIASMYPLDLLFRHDFQAASLGATWYLPEGDFTQNTDLIPEFFEGRAPFYQLLKTGLFNMTSLSQNQRVSPIEIKYNKAEDRDFITDNKPGDFLTTGYFGGELIPAPKNSFSKEILGIGRYAEVLFPKIPYGLTLIVPENKPINEVKGWSTDGRVLYKDGQPSQTATLVTELKAKSAQFPINSNNCFLSVQKIGNNYVLYVSTVGYLYPQAESAELTFNPKVFGTADIRLQDVLKNKTLTAKGNKLTINFKPGEIKILKLSGK